MSRQGRGGKIGAESPLSSFLSDLSYVLDLGFKNSQLRKKKLAVNNWTKSEADRRPSDKEAMLLSAIPNNQDEIPKNQIPFLRELKKVVASDDF